MQNKYFFPIRLQFFETSKYCRTTINKPSGQKNFLNAMDKKNVFQKNKHLVIPEPMHDFLLGTL